ncbi:MAG: hypothetical protein AAB014_00840 [Nitrospirota bacterium]
MAIHIRKAVRAIDRSGWINQKAHAPATAKRIPITATKIPSLFVKNRGSRPPLLLIFNFTIYVFCSIATPLLLYYRYYPEKGRNIALILKKHKNQLKVII